ncbi:MAG TPA: hypothetical protein VJ508_05550 [Saprospiraceae bacterium]|nr:hypothetical protein [Saprospiraceae bacterium]
MNVDTKELTGSSMPVAGACSGVYFLFHQDVLVYIGQSWNCFLGVAEQTRKESDKVFDRWSYIAVNDESERKGLLKELRAIHKPKYNLK